MNDTSALRRSIFFTVLFMVLAIGNPAWSESCSYREGIMALQQGNTVRGMALLRMASRDGDVRASRHLAALNGHDAQPRPKPSLQLLAANQPRDAR